LFKIRKVKKILVHFRTWSKFTILIILAAFLILGVIAFVYKPIYSVTLNGEEIGYSANKSELQEKINEYIEKGTGEKNIAFVEISSLPEYKLCLLKKDIVANDEEIFQKVISGGTTYYKYYAITEDDEEKAYVSEFSEAEDIIEQLKEKNSTNKEKLGILEKYETKLEEFAEVETVVADLYVKPVVKKSVTTYASYTDSVTVASTEKINLGISFIRPVSGTLTSRFGYRWGRGHKGIDIGAPKGTTIYAAASGTVTATTYGYGGGYGNHLIISHGNGVQTLYGHCTSLLVSAGEKVSQGEPIATVGNTGNSYGNHLHFEVRVNGVAQNPQNYVSY